MEASGMETSAATSRAPKPACPFESGARADKINFPDVLEVLPPRDGASDGETDAARRAGDGEEEDNTRFALESLDVEERRARDLADCTVEVVANTAPADIDVPEHAGVEVAEEDDDASDASSEDELAAAMRLAAAAAVEAEEIRCQKYFDEKEAAARVSGGRDPALCSPLWAVDSPGGPTRDPAAAFGASPSSEGSSPAPSSGSPADSLWSPCGSVDERDRLSPSVFRSEAHEARRAESRLALTPPRRRPFGRGVRTRARFSRVDEGDEDAETKNGLYELFCRSAEEDVEANNEAGTDKDKAALSTPLRRLPRDYDFAGISPIPNVWMDADSPDARRERRAHARRRSLFDADEGGGVVAAIAAVALDVSLDDSFVFDSPVATPAAPAHAPPRLARRGGNAKTRPRTGVGAEETSGAAVRLDLAEFEAAAAPSPPTTPPPRRHPRACASCGRSPPPAPARHALSTARDAKARIEEAGDQRSVLGDASPPRIETRWYGGSDADVSAAEDDDSARMDDSRDRVFGTESVSIRASARRRHRLRAARSEPRARLSSRRGENAETEKSAYAAFSDADFAARLEHELAARRPPLTPTELAVRGLAMFPSGGRFATPTMPFSASRAAREKPSDVDTARFRFDEFANASVSDTTNKGGFLDDSATKGGARDDVTWSGPIHRALAVSFAEPKTKEGLEHVGTRDEGFANSGRKLDFEYLQDVSNRGAREEYPYAFAAELRRIVNTVAQ
jgi:hypothetical protein